MKTLSISEIRKRLPQVIDGVVASEEAVVVTRHGRPVATVQPYRAVEDGAVRYPLRGSPIWVADDFDTPMPEVWDALAVAEKKGSYTTPKGSRKRRS